MVSERVLITVRSGYMITRIDAKTRQPGAFQHFAELPTGLEPYAVGVNRGRVWTTLVEEDAIQSVRFTR